MKGSEINMKRNCSLSDISDGKLYEINDMVKVGCNGCHGKASCCHGMGDSIVLDPFDIFRLTTNRNLSFQELLINQKIELNVVDGIILPNLKMIDANEQCSFLDDNGRCSIHEYRPGICRIFPLGRYYENQTFQYFLQVEECKNNNRTKTKVNKWIDTPDYKNNEIFLKNWHYFLNSIEEVIKNTEDDQAIKHINMYILNNFYINSYQMDTDFYLEFNDRLEKAKKMLSL